MCIRDSLCCYYAASKSRYNQRLLHAGHAVSYTHLTVGDKEYPIEFVVMDTEGLEEKTANVYQKLIEEEKVIAIAGPDSSKCMLAAAPIAQNAKCPAITSFGTNTAVTEVGDYIFRACFIDPFQGAVAAAYCDEQGHKTACIMFNNAVSYTHLDVYKRQLGIPLYNSLLGNRYFI